jgi:uncharacterized protein YdhG (YjbR/CyaY superfamily)
MKNVAPPQTVDEYLDRVPEPARTTLDKIRAVIRSAVPAETTEVISYQIPMYKYKGMLVGFAAFKKHCSLFPCSTTVVPAFRDELKNYETNKGTIRFPMDKPMPATLVRKIVKMRIAENDRGKANKAYRAKSASVKGKK